MAWQAGMVSSAADLVAAIRAFAVDHGWTLVGNVLSKGDAYVAITAPSASELRIRGARGGVFSGVDQCPRYSRIYLTSWPSSAEIQLFAFDGPDTVWCVMRTSATDYMHLGFGMIQKYGTWGGGQWFHAQHTPSSADGSVCSLIDGSQQPNYSDAAKECGLFWSPQQRNGWDGAYTENAASSLHCELRGYVWEPPTGPTGIGVHCPTILSPIHKTNPNVFNGQTVLTPFQLFLQNTDGHFMSVGHVGHLRFVRLTNYNPGDVVTIASDRWRVFPWFRKDTAFPLGKQAGYSDGSFSTGVLGVAVRYDGP